MKKTLKTFLFAIVFVAFFMAFTRFTGRNTISIDFGENALTLYAPKDYTISMEYDRIQSLELVELPEDIGSTLSGDENRRYSWGERENATWGTYTLCVSKKIDVAILVTTYNNEIFIYNFESDDTTTSMLQMFTELLAHREATA